MLINAPSLNMPQHTFMPSGAFREFRGSNNPTGTAAAKKGKIMRKLILGASAIALGLTAISALASDELTIDQIGDSNFANGNQESSRGNNDTDILQDGNHNTASARLLNTRSTSVDVDQDGNRNLSELNQIRSGDNNEFVLRQEGNRNYAGIGNAGRTDIGNSNSFSIQQINGDGNVFGNGNSATGLNVGTGGQSINVAGLDDAGLTDTSMFDELQGSSGNPLALVSGSSNLVDIGQDGSGNIIGFDLANNSSGNTVAGDFNGSSTGWQMGNGNQAMFKIDGNSNAVRFGQDGNNLAAAVVITGNNNQASAQQN